mmetsp:Transcript_7140/g.26266  ORF Transcript_7140/g.26266 Transcript_7140/m.26266 type:complete len:210 (+) Transcript_7140:176-805(+)
MTVAMRPDGAGHGPLLRTWTRPRQVTRQVLQAFLSPSALPSAASPSVSTKSDGLPCQRRILEQDFVRLECGHQLGYGDVQIDSTNQCLNAFKFSLTADGAQDQHLYLLAIEVLRILVDNVHFHTYLIPVLKSGSVADVHYHDSVLRVAFHPCSSEVDALCQFPQNVAHSWGVWVHIGGGPSKLSASPPETTNDLALHPEWERSGEVVKV